MGGCTHNDNTPVTATFRIQQNTVLWAIVNAYFRAAFLVEALKYFAVRRILYMDRVADAGGLLMYGLAAGAGFAIVEHLQYTLMHGLGVAYGRLVLAVPLHCLTGLIIAIQLGSRKFVGRKQPWYKILAMPVLIHGTYDVVLMLPKFVPITQPVRIVLAFITISLGMMFCRYLWMALDIVCIVDVKQLTKMNRMSKPKCSFFEKGNIPGNRVCEDRTQSFVEEDDDDEEVPTVPLRLVKVEEDIDEDDETSIFKTAFFPNPPICHTIKGTCRQCQRQVRIHRMYPSKCPFCKYENPDPFAQ